MASEPQVGFSWKLAFLLVFGTLIVLFAICIWISTLESPTELQNRLFEDSANWIRILVGAIADMIGGKMI